MTDISKPLFYRSTGKQLEIVQVRPVMQYVVRWPGGTDVVMTEAEINEKLTNENPGFIFDQYVQRSGIRFRALPDYHFIRVNTGNRGYGRGQCDMDEDAVRTLWGNLQQWLIERDRARARADLEAANARLNTANSLHTGACVDASQFYAQGGAGAPWPEQPRAPDRTMGRSAAMCAEAPQPQPWPPLDGRNT